MRRGMMWEVLAVLVSLAILAVLFTAIVRAVLVVDDSASCVIPWERT